MFRKVFLALAAVAAMASAVDAQVMRGNTIKSGKPQRLTSTMVMPNRVATQDRINPAHIAKNLPQAHYWNPVASQIDFSDADVWYFSPDGDSEGTGTREDPFPRLEDALRADSTAIAASATTGLYFSSYHSSTGAETRDGAVEYGDIAALMQGDHGRAWWSQRYGNQYIAFVGMRGAIIRNFYCMDPRYMVFEGIHFAQRRDLTPNPNMGAAADSSYLGAPTLLELRRSVNPGKNIIINKCTFSPGPGEDFRSWTGEEWNYRAMNSIYTAPIESVLICNSLFTGVQEGINSNYTRYMGVVENRFIYMNGDTWNVGADDDYFTKNSLERNTIIDKLFTNKNHLDSGISLYVQTDGVSDDVLIDGNIYLFNSRRDRDHLSYAAVHSNGGGFVGLWPNSGYGTNYPQHKNITISNNIISGGQYAVNCQAGLNGLYVYNNTFIPTWGPDNDDCPEHWACTYGPQVRITTPWNDDSVRRNIVIANNVMDTPIFVGYTGADSLGTITLVDNHIYATARDASDAEFGDWGYSVEPGAWNLTPAAGSPLIDEASATYAPATDINGTTRPIGLYDDIGAIESPHYLTLNTLVIAGGDSTDSSGFKVDVDITGSASDAVFTLLYETKLKSGTFGGGVSVPSTGGAFSRTHVTSYPTSSLTAAVDSLYVRARILVNGSYSPWVEKSVQRVRAKE